MKFCLYGFLIFSINLSFAQVPNAGFEQWSNGNPVGWFTSNITTPNVTQSTDAHTGSYAVRGDVIDPGTGTIIPIIISGLLGAHGFPVSERYSNLTGYYKLGVVTTENLSVVVAMYKAGQQLPIGVGGAQFFTALAYTMFSVPVYYSSGETPDSCQISITIGNNSAPVSNGAYFLVDDLAFQGASDVNIIEQNNPGDFVLEQNYPNPFNPNTTIQFTISKNSFVRLEIFNTVGEKVATLVSEELSAGSYKFNWTAGNLSTGTYYYRLTADKFTETKKLVLLK